MCPRPRPHRGRASFANGQNFREVGLHQCPSERKGEGGPVRSLHVPSHVPSHPQTAAKVRGFSPTASGFTAETDEEAGFELVWGFSCQVVVFGLLTVLCSEVCPGKAGMFSRRQSCRGKSQSPVVWIAEEMETEPSKPIDKISRGEITSHRAVSKENALWPRKK